MQGFKSTLCHSQELKQKCRQKPQNQQINSLYQNKNGSQCNYCHKGLSYSWGLNSNNYQPYTYQTMMQRGWRRCGTYYYKLDLQRSCCKQWTHRLDSNQFKIKKDQKKAIKKMMALAYEPVVEMEDENKATLQKSHNKKSQVPKQQQKTSKKQIKLSTKLVAEPSKNTQEFIGQICTKLNQLISVKLNQLLPKQKLSQQNLNKGWNLQFMDKLKSFTAKPQQKNDYYCNWGMLLYGSNKSKFQDTKGFPMVQFIRYIKNYVQQKKLPQDYKLTLERGGYLLIQLSQRLKEQNNEQFQIIKQVPIQSHSGGLQHHSQPNQMQEERVTISQVDSKQKEKHRSSQNMHLAHQNPLITKKTSSCKFQKLEPQRRGQLTITSDMITFGKLSVKLVQAEQNHESWRMYERYCKDIHEKEEKTLSSYTRFLCERALTYQSQEVMATEGKFYQPSFDPVQTHQNKRQVTGPVTKRVGCYHMKYYLQDKFIAVGVIDLLPNGLSSVYFFYQPEYKDRRLGVFSSIIEIQYVRYLSLTFPQFKYYYMGFYIHDNDKMTYKGGYAPYQLLCPITYNFVTVDDRVKQIVNKVVRQGEKNIRLAPQGIAKDPDMTFNTDLGLYIDRNIKLTYRRKPLNLKQINPEFYIPVLQLLKAYLNVWGKEIFDIFTFTF